MFWVEFVMLEDWSSLRLEGVWFTLVFYGLCRVFFFVDVDV